jgi:hypothetical protein
LLTGFHFKLIPRNPIYNKDIVMKYFKCINLIITFEKIYHVFMILEILFDKRTYAYFGDELCPKSRKGTRLIK